MVTVTQVFLNTIGQNSSLSYSRTACDVMSYWWFDRLKCRIVLLLTRDFLVISATQCCSTHCGITLHITSVQSVYYDDRLSFTLKNSKEFVYELQAPYICQLKSLQQNQVACQLISIPRFSWSKLSFWSVSCISYVFCKKYLQTLLFQIPCTLQQR